MWVTPTNQMLGPGRFAGVNRRSAISREITRLVWCTRRYEGAGVANAAAGFTAGGTATAGDGAAFSVAFSEAQPAASTKETASQIHRIAAKRSKIMWG